MSMFIHILQRHVNTDAERYGSLEQLCKVFSSTWNGRFFLPPSFTARHTCPHLERSIFLATSLHSAGCRIRGLDDETLWTKLTRCSRFLVHSIQQSIFVIADSVAMVRNDWGVLNLNFSTFWLSNCKVEFFIKPSHITHCMSASGVVDFPCRLAAQRDTHVPHLNWFMFLATLLHSETHMSACVINMPAGNAHGCMFTSRKWWTDKKCSPECQNTW